MANRYPNNTSKKQVKNPQQRSRISQGPLLLPKIPQQSLPLPSKISQQNLPLPSKVPPLLPKAPPLLPKAPPLLPKAPQNPPLPPNFLQQNPLLHSKNPQQPQEIYNYVKVPQDNYFLRSEISEGNQFYSVDPYFNQDLTQFLTDDKEQEQSLLTKV